MKITHTRVSFKDNRYHRAIPGEPSKNIPHWLFDAIITLQTALDGLHLQAKRYNEEVKDKPMVVMKNHIEPTVLAPGEIVTFNQDE
ncbi:MAG: hypothetical protein ACJ74J_10000 [Blastocatellia bacterium]